MVLLLLLVANLEDFGQFTVRKRNHYPRTHLHRLNSPSSLGLRRLLLNRTSIPHIKPSFAFCRPSTNYCAVLVGGELVRIPKREKQLIGIAFLLFLPAYFDSLSQFLFRCIFSLSISYVFFLFPEGTPSGETRLQIIMIVGDVGLVYQLCSESSSPSE